MQKVTLTINGIKHEVMAEPDEVLLDLLREDLNLTGTKQSCDRKGQCGACTVIVNGQTVLSCLKKVVDLEGADVITVEGLGTPDNPHLIQEAFVLAGAVQCGFCIPGMIMATKALLDRNPSPTIEEIKKALAKNMCRCTGYKKIIDAVILAGRFLRKETTPDEIRSSLGKGMIGVSHPRPWSMLKACGLAKFTDDIKIKGSLELALVHSTEFHALIKSVDTSAAEKMPGVVGIMTARDIKGTNRIKFAAPDQPVLCEDRVRTLGDPIVAIAAETREQARAAAKAVKVTYQPLPVMMTPEEALAPGAYQIHPHSPNLCYSQPLIKGDAEKALAEAAAVVEAEFSTQTNHQAPLEPESSIAYLEGEGEDARVVVIGRSIMIHTHGAQVAEAVGAKVRYQEAFSGGQFGVKIAITTEAVTAAAAMHFKRPVRYTPTMAESMILTTKRHAYNIRIKLAADSSGHLTALFDDFVLNKGAYTINGKRIMQRSVNMLSGSYNIPNIKALGRTVYTNNSPGGAARGAGPPQTIYALELAMNMLAEKLGIDPLEFRKMKSLKPGGTKATGMVVKEWPFPELCDAIKPAYDKAIKEAAEFNKKGGPLRRGVGIGVCAFGIAWGGDQSVVAVELDPDDGVTVYAAVADPGEGNDSMLSQIVAHVLDLPLDKVRLYTRDTDKTWENGPSAGSRQTWMSGNALVGACKKLKQAMEEAGSKTYAGLKEAGKPTRHRVVYNMPGENVIDPKTGYGTTTFFSECHNIQLAEVEVNTKTGATKVIRITSAVDLGPVINPQAAEGQLEGGMDQGAGYALREEYIHGKTTDYIKFKFPTIGDTFEMVPIIQETIRQDGPLGATGVGETTMVSTAPAVCNAIKDACGVWMCHLPATPEKVKKALTAKK
jgi:aldehyde oxidoreductase